MWQHACAGLMRWSSSRWVSGPQLATQPAPAAAGRQPPGAPWVYPPQLLLGLHAVQEGIPLCTPPLAPLRAPSRSLPCPSRPLPLPALPCLSQLLVSPLPPPSLPHVVNMQSQYLLALPSPALFPISFGPGGERAVPVPAGPAAPAAAAQRGAPQERQRHQRAHPAHHARHQAAARWVWVKGRRVGWMHACAVAAGRRTSRFAVAVGKRKSARCAAAALIEAEEAALLQT